MARKRPKEFIDLDNSQDSYGLDSEDLSAYLSDSESNDFEDSEVHSSGGIESIQFVAYQQVLKNYHELKVLKRQLAKTISLEEAKKQKSAKRPKEVFTRFSVSSFSSILDALTPENREVIENSGLGSLLLFQKCYVPNKFVKWVAELVNYRSADIVVDGKVISLTKESVHLVLGLPMADKHFPSDPSGGKAIVLSMFEKQSLPSVKFFANKILKHQTQSDEDLIICFILVAMNSFLCPNTSSVRSYRYFGIFEDINNLNQCDWCGYILDWLLDCVKSFNRGKSISSGFGGSLGGCLYYLAVLYLDYVDFGVRQVSDSIPRITVWKDSMIQTYAQLDMKSPGSYGYHPLLDVSHTCYSKDLRFLYYPMCVNIYSHFAENLDQFSGRKLPDSLKASICKLIQNYLFNSGVSVKLDVNHVSAMPDSLKSVLCKLLNHVYSIDSRIENLVLDLLKLIANAYENNDRGSNHDNATSTQHPNVHEVDEEMNSSGSSRRQNLGNSDAQDDVPCSQYEAEKATNLSSHIPCANLAQFYSSPSGASDAANNACKPSAPLPVPKLHCSPANSTPSNVDNDVIARVMQNLTKNTHFCHNEIKKSDAGPSKIRLDKAKNPSPVVHAKEPAVSAPKKLKHSAIFNANHHTQSDVIMLDKENYYAPDSISPSPKPGMTRFFSKQAASDKDNESPPLSQRTPIVMQTIGCTPHSTQRKSSAVSQRLRNSSSRFNSRLTENHSDSPEVKIVGERSLDDSVRAMSKKSDIMYNSKLQKSAFKGSAPQALCPAPNARSDVNDSQSFSFRARDSTTGGKLPVHGPRRVVKPGPLFKGGCVTGSNSNKFHVSKSEIDNYNSIVKLALSEFQGEDAVNLSGVRCTFWALGDSLKPGGVVKSFVVSVFAYSLFSKPSGHPVNSRRHYFFSNISDQLLKDVDEADQDVLARAFRRSSKARPLNQSNMLFYPTFFQDHWFVFVVDIKDRMYVILDSVFKKDDEYQVFVRGRLRNSFEIHWDKYVGLDMGFENYEFVYPAVPEQPPENSTDSGIYCMMFLEHWMSTRTSLTTIFSHTDIPHIRIKIANDLVFQPKNLGMKHRVVYFNVKGD